MRCLLILAAIAKQPQVVQEILHMVSVDSKVHKLCLQAKDYIGCVKAQSGQSNSIEVFNNPGTASARGNSCPAGYAYIGNGYCREVVCTHLGGQNAPVISGKQWRPSNPMRKMKYMDA